MNLNEYLQKNVENNHEVFNRRFSKPYYNYNMFISDNISMADFVSKYGLPEECDIKFVNEYKTDVPDKDRDTCSAWFDSELLIFSLDNNVFNEIKLVFLKNNKTENNEVKTNKIEIDTIADLYEIEDKRFIKNYRKGYFKGIKFVGTLEELSNVLEFTDVSQLKLFDISDYQNDDCVIEIYHHYSGEKAYIWFDEEKTISNNCCTLIQYFNVNCIEDIKKIDDYRFEYYTSDFHVGLSFKGCYDDLNKLLKLDNKNRFSIEANNIEEYVTITDYYTHESIKIFLFSGLKEKPKDKSKNESNDNKITIETLEDFKKLEKIYHSFFVDRYDARELHFRGNFNKLFNIIKISKNIKLSYMRYDYPDDHICLRLCYSNSINDSNSSTNYSFIEVSLSDYHNPDNGVEYLEEIIKEHNDKK